MLLSRRLALGLAGAAALPRFAIGQSDNRPSLTIAVQKITTSNTLEPMREQSNVGQRIFYTFAETLTDHAWTGDLSLRPGLAESFRRIDGRTLELKLRQNVRFHNGDGMTAEDVAFSFGPERMWTGSSVDTRGMWTNTTPGLDQQGATARGAQDRDGRLSRLRAHGDRRQVHRALRQQGARRDLEGRLTRNTGVIFSQRAFAEAATWLDWARRPVGTGPYRIVDFKPDVELVMEAFDDYWGGRPPIKRLRFVEVPEVASRANGLRAGDFDFACDMPPDQIASIESNPRYEVVGGPIMNIRLTIFDKHHPVLKDARVRQAMTHAVDRQAIVDALWAGRTRVPKGMQWDFFGPMLLADWAPPAYDPALATPAAQGGGLRRRADPLPDAEQLLHQPGADRAGHGRAVEGGRPQRRDRDEGELGPDPRPLPGPRHLRELELVVVQRPGGLAVGLHAGRPDLGGRPVGERGDDRADGGAAGQHRHGQAPRQLPAHADPPEREDPVYNVVHQNATFTAKRRDYKWRPAQSFVVDFRASNWG